MIPLNAPCLEGNEWKYVKECLDTGWISSAGNYVDSFARNMADYLGVKYAVACMNGTSALHLALLLAEVKPGDEVIVPTVTFIAPVNAVNYVGAQPIFMDCDAYCTLDVSKTEEFLKTRCTMVNGTTFNTATGRRIAAVIPVHVFGIPVDMDPLQALAERYKIKIIEDASESLGSEYRGKKTGTLGLLGCLSFNGNKIITTGGGGMIVTDDERLATRARYLSTQAKEEGSEYVHNEIGFNYRMVNVLAAIGMGQLEKLDDYIKIKRKNFLRYRELLADQPYTFLDEPAYATSNRWLYAVMCKDKGGKESLLSSLAGSGIEARPLWRLNHLQKPYLRCQSYRIETAPRMYDTIVNIPSSVTLTEAQLTQVAEAMKEACREEQAERGADAQPPSDGLHAGRTFSQQ